jgi:hypothetical protein
MSTLDVYGIHLLRDVRGVVTSQLRRNARIDAREGARRWVRLHQRLQTSLNAQLGSKYLRVRYEDLCRDPSGTLRRLYAFCGADPDVVIDDFRAAPHHIVGNPMRLNHLSEIRLDERWRTFLTSKQLQEIEQVAGAFSLRYGYR